MQHGRGVALADFNRDGRTDIVYGNWNGPHRLFMQLNNRKQKFKVGPDGLPPFSSFSRLSRLLSSRSSVIYLLAAAATSFPKEINVPQRRFYRGQVKG